jgi:hypothetical protein
MKQLFAYFVVFELAMALLITFVQLLGLFAGNQFEWIYYPLVLGFIASLVFLVSIIGWLFYMIDKHIKP